MDQSDWEKAEGVVCRSCGVMSLRIVDGLCAGCCSEIVQESDNDIERKSIKRAWRRGLLSKKDLRRAP